MAGIGGIATFGASVCPKWGGSGGGVSTDTRLGAGGTKEDTGRALPLRNDGGNGGGVKYIVEGPAAPDPEAEAGVGAMGTAPPTG